MCVPRSPGVFEPGSRRHLAVEIGGNQPHTASTPQPADVRRDQGAPQRGQQPFRRYGAWRSERTLDVLVVHEPLDQRDPAAPRGSQAAQFR